MGKKSKKTRWRTLTLNGHQSDSEESSSKSSIQTSKGYQHKYSKFPYSSQSTPIRKFQHESSKSTRSNSTTSEHKATFNEDEYTRITTPRQDVLFKKGYLNKPKSYQTQTSTGTSSTANSTSTCTPDHQSADGTEGTDLEYESQFVFPNGFIDQNGIYYINSYEPFPFVVYNAPICYPEYPHSRSKRYSTDSLTESVSPHNEEAGQEIPHNGAGERINNTPVFTQSYIQPAGYYFNGACTLTNGQYTVEESRRLKKRRRRKVSRSKSNHEDVSCEGSDESESSDEVFSQSEGSTEHKRFPKPLGATSNQSQSTNVQIVENPPAEPLQDGQSEANQERELENHQDVEKLEPEEEALRLTNGVQEELLELPKTESGSLQEPLQDPMEVQVQEVTTAEGTIEPLEQHECESGLVVEEDDENDENKPNLHDAQNLLLQSLLKNSEKIGEGDDNNPEHPEDNIPGPPQDCNHEPREAPSLTQPSNITYSLKPDAEEFIPRTFRAPEALPFDPNVQFLNLPPNFIPIPFVNHIGELQRTPFLPPGIPLNFVPSQDPKLLPNFVNLVPNGAFVPKTFDEYADSEVVHVQVNEEPEVDAEAEGAVSEEIPKEAEGEREPEPDHEPEPEPEVPTLEELVQAKKPQTKTEIDIAKIVSKLEEAAKQQRFYETKRQTYNNRVPNKYSAKPYGTQRARYGNKYYQENQHYPESRYNQRSHPNSLEKQYERKYRRPEQGFQPKPNFDQESERLEVSVPTAEVLESRLQSTESAQIPERQTNTPAQQNSERKWDVHGRGNVQKRLDGQRKQHQGDQNPVNNVNSRIGESCSMTKDLKAQEGTVNYSGTLKKKPDALQSNTNSSTNSIRYERHSSEKVERKSEPKPLQITTPKPQKGQNQWISVSSRKKRKNKTANEEQTLLNEQDEGDEEPHDDYHLFESFDVNLLEDVVPPSKPSQEGQDPASVIEPPAESKKEDNPILEDLISKKDELLEVLKEETQEIGKTLPVNPEVAKETPTPKNKKKRQSSDVQRKKSKKGVQKPQTKRVIITDLDLELNIPVPKSALDTKPKIPKNEEKGELISKTEEDPQPSINENTQSEDLKVDKNKEEPNAPVTELLEQNQESENNKVIPEDQDASVKIDLESPNPSKPHHEGENPLSDNHTPIKNHLDGQNSSPNNQTVIKCDLESPAKIQTSAKPHLDGENPSPKTEIDAESLNPSSSNQTQTSESDTITETPEKKSKKKKKKAPKPLAKIQSTSSSNTTLNILDDSYEFLLETAIVEDFEQKTNVEISQELDRMIQKGMYSSLEEKIRALKISASDDGFFQTINYGVLETNEPEKPSVMKASNFGKMLRNTTQLLKMPRGNEDIDQQNLINIDFSKIKLPDLEPQPSTSKSGIFLENPEVNELIKSATNNKVDTSLGTVALDPPTKTKNNGKLKNKSKKIKNPTKPDPPPEDRIKKGEEHNGTIEQESKNLTTSNTFSSGERESPMRKSPPKQDSLYPITQAVKDWMTRTRENTPDVEILKSPNTIYKEFYETEAETESESSGDSQEPLNGVGSTKHEPCEPKHGLGESKNALGERKTVGDSNNGLGESKNGLNPKTDLTDSKNFLGHSRPAKSVSRESSPLSNHTKDDRSPGARIAQISNITNDDEITLWSVSPQNSIDEDLLDCWENDLNSKDDAEEPIANQTRLSETEKRLQNGLHATKVLVQNGGIKEIKGSVQNGCQAHLNGHIEEGEEAIEAYESAYGKNEDFLKLKAEIEEQQKNLNFPKHGNLPYRAICCSIM